VILPSAAARLGISGKPLFEGSANPLMQFLEGGQPQMVTVDVRVGEVEVKGLKMTIYNMPQLSLPTRLLGIKADGVLGYNFISRFVVTIDYAKEEIILVKNDYKPIDLLDPEMRAEWQEKLVERLEELFGKRRPRVKFGVKTRALSQEELDKLGLEGAVKVVAVKSDSPADKAGLVCGDVIYQLNGKKIRSRKHYLRMKRQLKPGQKVRLKVLREDGSRQELVLELPSEQEKRQAEEKSKSQRGSERRDQGAAQEIGTEEF
jgi:membrane-associated protease RseP (regulator of RpoE activity)